MNACYLRESTNLPSEEVRSTAPEPVPAKHGKRRPLQARTNWDPWLSANEAYPEVVKPLRMMALVLLTVVGFLFLLVVLMFFGVSPAF